jgi:hypothetical protein
VGRGDNSAAHSEIAVSSKRAVPAAARPCTDQVASSPG